MKKILMVIMDGIGLSDNIHGNAVKQAPMNNLFDMLNHYPNSKLYASGEEVGLSLNEPISCPYAHTLIGAGYKLTAKDKMIENLLDDYHDNDKFLGLIEKIKEGKKVHVIGMLSDGMLHSSFSHFEKLVNVFKNEDIHDVSFQLISDGKDTDSKSFYTYYSKLEKILMDSNVGTISSICGRYYAMDRDKDYSKTKKYYDLLTKKVGYIASNIPLSIQKCYENNLDDQNIIPLKTKDYQNIKEGDIVIWMNYRSDRSKQILTALCGYNFDEFSAIDLDLDLYTFFKPSFRVKATSFLETNEIENPLLTYLSKLGLSVNRISEEEKFMEMTYAFDGEKSISVEDDHKIMIPKVENPLKNPPLSAVNLTKKAMSLMEKDVDVIVVSYSSADVLAHTGKMEETTKACISVDLCLKVLKDKAEENFYTMIVFSDHGNAEEITDESGRINTKHTLNKVPFIIMDDKIKLKSTGSLINIAPTILDYMDIARPVEMKDSESLLEK